MANKLPQPLPRATYRLQLTADCGFDHAAAIADYLAVLGVSHVYTSPFFQAAPGSTHGYDGVDPEHISNELGGEEAFERFADALGRNNLALLVDVVPNHLSIACRDNWRWWDVLRLGRRSRYADWFDIDWDAPQARPPQTVLLPVLGDHVGICIEKGEIRLVLIPGPDVADASPEDRVELAYYDQHFPIAPGSAPQLPAEASDDELQQIIDRINADRNAVQTIVTAQHYRLAYWKTGPDELNYRRFFAVNELLGVRVELPHVFRQTHSRLFDLLHQGRIHGLRIDHPDGLRNPTAYLQRLRDEAPDTWIIVEKILQPGERLPDDWPVHGTTGYDFLNQLGSLWIDPRGQAPLSLFYEHLTGSHEDYSTVLRQSKAHVARVLFGAETSRLAGLLAQVCRADSRHSDYTLPQINAALQRMLVAFPVYRSYVAPAEPDESTDELSRPQPQSPPQSPAQPSDQDAAFIEQAARNALAGDVGIAATGLFRGTIPPPDQRLINFIRDVLLMKIDSPATAEFIYRFQQLTGPLMAKGAEDTAFYRYNRLVALNEVGGDPGAMALPLPDFHDIMIRQAVNQPLTMRSTSTHDTKRSEDVRPRIAMLSEMSDQWAAAVRRWEKIARPLCPHERPDANDRYFIYQTLVGTWPISLERIQQYMLKAEREAKRRTSWKDPAPKYEDQLRRFLQLLLESEDFSADLEAFIAPIIQPARHISLGQTLVKLTVPGVPDIFQGCELEELSLVDPDNRHNVDFNLRRSLLAELIDAERRGRAGPDFVLRHSNVSMAKLFVTRRTLALRQAVPQPFAPGSGYRPLWAAGPRAENIIAFTRTTGHPTKGDHGELVIALVPRWLMSIERHGWADTLIHLPPGQWRNVFSGAEHAGNSPVFIADLLAAFPVVLLASADRLDSSPMNEILTTEFNANG